MINMKILYYTSTGNNLYIAKQLGGDLYSIPQLMKDEAFDIEDEIVGIVFSRVFCNVSKDSS